MPARSGRCLTRRRPSRGPRRSLCGRRQELGGLARVEHDPARDRQGGQTGFVDGVVGQPGAFAERWQPGSVLHLGHPSADVVVERPDAAEVVSDGVQAQACWVVQELVEQVPVLASSEFADLERGWLPVSVGSALLVEPHRVQCREVQAQEAEVLLTSTTS